MSWHCWASFLVIIGRRDLNRGLAYVLWIWLLFSPRQAILVLEREALILTFVAIGRASSFPILTCLKHSLTRIQQVIIIDYILRGWSEAHLITHWCRRRAARFQRTRTTNIQLSEFRWNGEVLMTHLARFFRESHVLRILLWRKRQTDGDLEEVMPWGMHTRSLQM